jgi:outer membrane protein OmpA-like peptidoglycan-associated protein
MYRILSIFFFLLLSSIASFSDGQTFRTSSSSALKAYKEGVSATENLQYSLAEAYFREAVREDDTFFEAHIQLGELFLMLKRNTEAAYHYKKAVRIDSLRYKPVFFPMANAEMRSGDYENALVHFKVYLAQEGMQEKNRLNAARNIKNCEFAIKAIKNPVPFNPVSVGNGINTVDDEYWPSITADGQTMMFTRQANIDPKFAQYEMVQEDFYVSYFYNGNWIEAFNAGTPLNTEQNEGAQALSSNGNYMYFTACDRKGGVGSCDIFFSAVNDGRWSTPINLKRPVNSQYWESQPSVTADGRMLFFCSNRGGGQGGKDIWYSVMDDSNNWKEPVNMGKSINTTGDEMSPFIHFDGRTLYFSSDGRTGMGGFDIFVTRMNSDTTWSEPQNLGYPINTVSDEMGLITESGGRKAYFSSMRDKKYGKDIFSFELYDSIRAVPVAYLKGKVVDKEKDQMVQANYELINLTTNKVTINSITDKKGNFLVCLPSGYNYGINVSKQGYLFYSENFMLEGQHTALEPFVKKIELTSFKVGEKMKLSNVFYEVDSWELKKESLNELNILAKMLNDNMELKIEVGGYTDSTGTPEYNLTLSEKRALSVVNYLLTKGIAPGRLIHKGYGNAFPVGDNINDEGRKLNRRTEVKILETLK